MQTFDPKKNVISQGYKTVSGMNKNKGEKPKRPESIAKGSTNLLEDLVGLNPEGENVGDLNMTDFPYDAHLRETGLYVKKDFPHTNDRKENQIDVSGNMENIELIQKNSQEEIELTQTENDEERNLVGGNRSAKIEISVDAVIELINRSLSEQYNIDLQKFDVNHLIKYKRRVRADLI